jgi:hypothetical protein
MRRSTGGDVLVIALALAAALDQEPQPMNPTQEIAKETPAGPALMAGPTEIRIGGYLGVTGIFRSTEAGGGPGTNFATIPYSDSAQGNLSEARLTAQASRLSIRVNAAPAPGRSTLAGYFEMDFNGATPGNVAVTSTSVGFRLRLAFGEAYFNERFLIAAGQGFSLMTPTRNQLSMWPSDYDLSQAVDTNYLVGTVWGRIPQVRFTYRPSPKVNWAVSVENPEQQLGNGVVTLPACCSSDLGTQYNTGSNDLSVPNLMPDVVSRIALNPTPALHVDVGGVLRAFRHTLQPYNDSIRHVGGGVNANARVNAAASTVLVGQLAFGTGLGRYIGGLVPDVCISADGAIHPIGTSAWVAGLEQKVSSFVSLAAYDSGVHADSNYSVDVNGTYVGFGYPGSSHADNRSIHEVTAVFAWQPWKIEGRGSMQWNTQLSWLTRKPWSAGTKPSSAEALLFFTQIRYNLP